MSPELQGPEPESDLGSGTSSQQEQYQNLAAETLPKGRISPAARVGHFDQSVQAAHHEATQLAAEPEPLTGTVVPRMTQEVQVLTGSQVETSLSPRDIELVRLAVGYATGAEADFENHPGRFPTWLKNAAKSASIGAIGSISIGVAENYAHSKGWKMLPADGSVGEAWFMLVQAYFGAKAMAANLKEKTGH